MRLGSRKILYTALFSCKFFKSEERNLRKHKTQQLEVNSIGKPSIEALPEHEREIFYAALLKKITELAAKGGE